jgi:hypothetical protein
LNRSQKVATVCLCLIVLGVFGIAVNRAMRRLAIKPPGAGDKLPYLDLSNIRAPAFQRRESKTLFVFVREDCKHCEALLHTLNQLSKSQSIQFPTVNVIVVGSKEHARQLASHLESFNIYSDPGGINFEACHGTSVPLQFLTDQNDIVLAAHKGEMDSQSEQLLLQNLKQ